MKDKFFVPVIAHNMRGYDSHLIIKHMEKKFDCADIDVIASNTEKFISFSIGQLRFLDSLQFLNASLDALVSNLKKDEESTSSFAITRRHYPDEDTLTRITRKGVYPYEYMDCRDKFEDNSLPSIDKFFSKLYSKTISEEEYGRAQDVWSHFGIQTMQDYHDLYLKTDTLLLVDLFETFRQVAIFNYGLDPCHYFTSHGHSMSE